jgi:phosphoglycolate phosphatase
MTLTDIYREEAVLYDGIAELINALIQQQGVCVGIITCNITHEPKQTLKQLLKRNGVNTKELDFLTHVPLKHEKSHAFRQTRDDFHINPALAYACGDEKKDFYAAVTTCMHPFMVSYGFEDYERLTDKIGVPPEIIARTPQQLEERLMHTMGSGKKKGKD